MISFAYDNLNRQCTKTIASSATSCSASSSPYPTVWRSYDLAGRLIGVRDNSASMTGVAGSAGYSTNIGYDALNRPINVTWSNAPTQTAPTASSVTFAHAYNGANQRIGQTVTDNSWLQYPSGASSVSYTPNALNQYSAVGAVSPTYDGNGNLTTDGSFTYCYDAENRLTSASGGGQQRHLRLRCTGPPQTEDGEWHNDDFCDGCG